MPHYTVSVFNDMGHIMTEPWIDKIPNHISKYILNKCLIYLKIATDTSDLGCRFYILREGFQKKWIYNLGEDTIEINWDVNTFDPKDMRWI